MCVSLSLFCSFCVSRSRQVDAVYRLTASLPITFSNNVPVAVPPGIMTPFNSQATVFYHRAFWGLLIPISVTFRVCDIWRGYLVERLLWDIDAALSFVGPRVIQYRNPHDYLDDFASELQLYSDAGRLISFLLSFSDNSTSFSTRYDTFS